MRAARQPVDHGDGGMRCEFQQRVVIEDADHDRIDIARQHARGISDGLAATELHLGTGEHDRFTAKLAHADIERHPRAGRGTLEDHRQRLAFERLRGPLIRLQPRLHGGAGSEHGTQLIERHFVDIEEVTGHRAHYPVAFLDGSLESAMQARSRQAMDCSISGSLTISGARKRTTLSPAPTVSSFCWRRALTRSPEGTTALTPISSPSPRTSARMAG